MEKTAISWTDYSWNPWRGCHKVSQGCKNCYMFREQKRYGNDPNIVLRSKTTFKDPLKLKDPAMVFTCSWSDFFIEEADEWRDEAWDVIRKTPHLTYQILTKRPERIGNCFPEGSWIPRNVWWGISAENQEALEKRWSEINHVFYMPDWPVRFISAEPLLGPLDLSAIKPLPNWVIVGGESGPSCRPMNIDWARSIMRQCREYEIPYFMKQLGGHPDRRENINQFPEDLRIQEYPARSELGGSAKSMTQKRS